MDPRELYRSDDLTWLERQDHEVEGSFVERKEWCDADKLAQQISGFANGQPPGGLIVVGVTREGRVAGLGDRVGKLNEILGQLSSRLDWSGWEHRWVSGRENQQVLFVFSPFSANRVVCLSDGRAYRRQGERTLELPPDQILELRYARGERSFETEPATKFSEGVLDPEQTKAFLEGVVARNGLTLPLTVGEAAANKGLLTSDGDLNFAAVLALGRNPLEFLPGARLRFLKFEGTEELSGAQRNVVKDRWFEGPIPRIVAEFRTFMRSTIREFDYLGPEGKFVTEPEYPEPAWEEAVVNALVHRSYSISNAAVFVRMFEDHVEVESPGVFPSSARPDAEGVFPLSAPRNPKLAEALRYFEIVRLAREGTRRMHDEMVKLHLPPPKFEEVAGVKVVVTLFNDIERRRARLGSPAITHQWAEVGQHLVSDLAIYRRRALDLWSSLSASGAGAPSELLSSAAHALRSATLEAGEKARLFQLVAKDPRALDSDVASVLAEDLLNGDYHQNFNNLGDEIARFLSQSDGRVAFLLAALEEHSPMQPAVVSQVFRVLGQRLNREPFPERAWIERVLRLAKANGTVQGAVDVHALITGQPP